MTEIDTLTRRIRDEFKEMPGLRLTPAQAMRLWGVETKACYAVIDSLVAAAFLRWTPGGRVTRTDFERES